MNRDASGTPVSRSTRAASTPSDGRLFHASVVLSLAWGVVAFGAEYAWAYFPLIILNVVAGVLGRRASSATRFQMSALAISLAVLVVAALLQIVPMPRRAIAAVSPSTLAVDYSALYAKATMAPASDATQPRRASISIAPRRTVLAVLFLSGFLVLFGGSLCGLNTFGPRMIARSILMLGALIALLELGQKASRSDVVYGWWYPPQLKGYHSAPFVNRNHTAGWLLMSVSVSAGCFFGAVAQRRALERRDWRNRILWLGSREASQIVLSGLAVALMAIAIIITASRSAFVCLAVLVAVLGWFVVRRQPSGTRRILGAVYLVLLPLVAAVWGGVDAVLQRLPAVPYDIRPAVWQDTLRLIHDFPIAGVGLNAYGIAMLHYQTAPGGELMIEAHNDYLQIAAEGGLLLGVPIVICLFLFVREAWRRFHENQDDPSTLWLRVGAVTGLLAIAAQEVVDFTLQMPGAVALFVVLLAIAIHKPYRQSTSTSDPIR